MRRSVMWVVAAVALLSAGCGAELSPGATVLQAADETRSAGSARVSYVAVFEAVSAPGPLMMTGEGVFDYAHQLGRMVIDMSALLRSPGGAPEGSSEVEMIVDDQVIYMKMPFLTESLPDPRPWIKIDLEAATAAGRTDLTQFTQLGQGDPTQVLELLRGVTRRVENLGNEELRGAATTHYETVLDLAKVAEEVPESLRGSVESLIGRAGSSAMPADVWIDTDGRMRKLVYRVGSGESSEGGATSAEANKMSVTMELFEFGVDVKVEPPPDGQVVDLLRSVQTEASP
ncbi:MAG: hypothetical protein ABR529_08665 [Actinomycetota bacterium]